MAASTLIEELVTDRLPPISLAELNARAALQVRVDSKYVLTLDRFRAFVDALQNRCEVLAIDGRRAQRYDTVYFDSPVLTCYRDHLQRRRKTYKLRSRVYVGSGLHVFEVKMRDGRGHTVKRKIDHSGVPPEVVGDEATHFYRETIGSYYNLDVTHPVAPSMRNQYSRVTLASRSTPERTTVDFDLAVLGGADLAGSMRRDVALVETKSARGNGEIDRILWRLGARPVRVSKYCIGIALLHPYLPVNRYSRAMNRFFRSPTPVPQLDAGLAGARWDPAADPREPPRAPRPPRAVRAPTGARGPR